tara:strand:- start:2986 stop:3171 length:186 start_codon:yes stop_codon:yes gene_type:complete
MHYFRLLINNKIAIEKGVKGTYEYAVSYMAGYIQAFQDARDANGDTADIEVIYIPEEELTQ